MIKTDNYIKFFKNQKALYLVLIAGFVIWMLFFDAENWVSYFKMRKKYYDLVKQREYYIEQKHLIEQEREKINGDMMELEKFAREKYLMKRKSEDIYVIKD